MSVLIPWSSPWAGDDGKWFYSLIPGGLGQQGVSQHHLHYSESFAHSASAGMGKSTRNINPWIICSPGCCLRCRFLESGLRSSHNERDATHFRGYPCIFLGRPHGVPRGPTGPHKANSAQVMASVFFYFSDTESSDIDATMALEELKPRPKSWSMQSTKLEALHACMAEGDTCAEVCQQS